MQKVDAQTMEEHNALLWAKKIFKTRPDNEISASFKEKIQTVFHHLTKEELIAKILADHLRQRTVSVNPQTNTPLVNKKRSIKR
jgi:ATP-dependent RNA helicase DeaD